MNPRLVIIAYLAALFTPLGLAFMTRFEPRSFLDELASGAGIVAFSAILLEFVFSGRFRTISLQTGMDVTMRLHQLLARTALGLALIHPFLYQAQLNPPYPWDTTRQLTVSWTIESISTGIVAWLLLGTLFTLAIGRNHLPYRYETWRLMHGLLGLLIALLALHHALYAGRYSQDPALVLTWKLFTFAAAFSLLYVYALKPLWQLAHPWSVTSVRNLGLKTWELELEPVGHAGIPFRAGEFAWINIGNSPFSLCENPFSISSAPSSGKRLQFVIKELGDFTDTVGSIRPGTRAFVDGSFGNLVTHGRTEPGIALLAGGVGIAPLMAILREHFASKDHRPVTLIYGNRVKEQIVYHEELDDLARQFPLTVVHVLSEPPPEWNGETGMIDATLIASHFDNDLSRKWLFVVCGPPPMLHSVENALLGLGIPGKQILLERFQYD